MRFALLADIHGNLPALEAVMRALKVDAPDDILVAGDWISGPCENETFDLLRRISRIPSWVTAISVYWSIWTAKPPPIGRR